MNIEIYTYKVTFPYQKWYYWGAHKVQPNEKFYNGSPVTHKGKWEDFEWEIQILEYFDNWSEAQRVENRLIKHTWGDPYCLNEHWGSQISTERLAAGGKMTGSKLAREGRLPKKKGNPVAIVKGGETHYFDKQVDAARWLGVSVSLLSGVLNNNFTSPQFHANYLTK